MERKNTVGALKDPVCGMNVDPRTAKHQASHEGHPYYFCSAGCKSKFEAEPSKYRTRQVVAEAISDGAIYTCPMHPKIMNVGPGNCPICGMTLEPDVIRRDAPPNAELTDMTRRFWFALTLAIPVFILEMGSHVANLGHLVNHRTSGWVQFALATPVVLWAGWAFFERAWQSLLSRNLNMFTLIAMGTGVSWGYSVIALLFPQVFPSGTAVWTAKSASISRQPLSSQSWFCSARC